MSAGASPGPTLDEVEEELQAIQKAKLHEQQSKAEIEEFKRKLQDMKSLLQKIKAGSDDEKSNDMKEVCLFTIYQCNQHIIH